MKCPHCDGTGELPEPSLGDMVLHWRKKRGLTQAELAAECSISRPQIANIEAGRSDVPTLTLRRLADALKCRPGDFLR